MKILVASDLHLEFEENIMDEYHLQIPEGMDIDAVILAGDIAVGTNAIPFIKKLNIVYPSAHIFYTPGNHEYYKNDILTLDEKIRTEIESLENNHKIHYLQGDSYILNRYKFIGATLWTNFNNGDSATMAYAENRMSDYRAIQNLTTKKVLELHNEHLQYIQSEIVGSTKPVILITHHALSSKSVHPIYAGNALNPCFYSDLEHVLENVTLAVHGHTHHSFDYNIGDCRVFANPRGYIGYENCAHDFKWQVVEV